MKRIFGTKKDKVHFLHTRDVIAASFPEFQMLIVPLAAAHNSQLHEMHMSWPDL